MVDFSLEQKKAIALANARARMAASSGDNGSNVEPIGAGEDVAKSLAGGIERGVAAVPMVIPNLLNQAVAGPQYLYEGLVGDDKKDFKPWQPFYSSEDVLQSLPESLRPHDAQTIGGVGADLVGQLVGGVAGGKAIQSAGPKVMATGSELLKDTGSKGFPFTGPSAEKPVYDPIATHSAISDSYGAVKDNANKYYNFMRSLAEGHEVKASGLKDGLDNIIEDIKLSTVPHEGAVALRKLEQIRDGIGGDDTIPLNTAVELKQFLNSNFNPKRFMESRDNPYYQTSKLTNTVLSKAAKDLPDFGEAKNLADRYWVNAVEQPFQKNSVLQKFWKPEDYYARQSVENGLADKLPDQTVERATTMLGKVRNPVQLDAITRVLPEDTASIFRSALLDDIKQSKGGGRLGSFGKAIMGAPNLTLTGIKNTLVNLGETVGGPSYAPDQLALMKAAKSPNPRLPNVGTQFEELQAFAGKPRMSVLGPKALPAPEDRLALPSPERPLVNDYPGGPLRPMTDDELVLHKLPASEQMKRVQKVPQKAPVPEMEQLKAARKTSLDWDTQAQALFDKGFTPKEIYNQIGQRPSEPAIPQDYGREPLQRQGRMKNISEWEKAADALGGGGLTYKEIVAKIGKRPEEPPEFKRGGHAKKSVNQSAKPLKNLTAEFLARKYAC